ncbi:hypothetical protein NM688_g944 [Phlebia brevispora]|uniref:Uncharacterized protein n=1 Tax=Phlebia brevispora TaxID=194682 RepID=A0ACC1TCK7_9APHY|nr:hypothetical protein NM688_g944 [Phlebia brevispora]
MLTQGDLADLNMHPAYLSPHYSSPPQPSQVLESHYATPPERPALLDALSSEPERTAPFQYSSSSLSLALTLPSTSPSSSYLRTPPASQPRTLSSPSTPIIEITPSASSDVSFMSNPQDFMTVSHPASSQYAHNVCQSEPANMPAPAGSDDLAQETNTGYACGDNNSLSPRSAVQAYPTPVSSPLIVTPPVETLPDTSPDTRPAPVQDPHRHYRTPEQKKAAASKNKIPRRKPPDTPGSEPLPPTRLSATLPVTSDATILAYACGHESCWPSEEASSKCCYATSQELNEHWKTEHIDDMSCSTPFRCSLAGCGKSWKSINGLQYHLQISKAHFQRAVTASLVERANADEDDAGKRMKFHKCPRPNCPNKYRQLSGLRYHLAHGHQEESLPTQLEDVPPTLAKKIAKKMEGRTHRRN